MWLYHHHHPRQAPPLPSLRHSWAHFISVNEWCFIHERQAANVQYIPSCPSTGASLYPLPNPSFEIVDVEFFSYSPVSSFTLSFSLSLRVCPPQCQRMSVSRALRFALVAVANGLFSSRHVFLSPLLSVAQLPTTTFLSFRARSLPTILRIFNYRSFSYFCMSSSYLPWISPWHFFCSPASHIFALLLHTARYYAYPL